MKDDHYRHVYSYTTSELEKIEAWYSERKDYLCSGNHSRWRTIQGELERRRNERKR